ncbi:aminobenzoyl-glutamate utilization protein B [Amphibacillus marinus]|uniref:Aminobenzoyl-glutamate utilization protein B n=1 Tax=Amphibacillus marinus TaxID=872970 RepID=A0A1H8S6A9_9BACI|nr:M20 family metallopeptidase [Amphibacillus marinus]SEO74549.1 aminobenzoyl-glutamate utilization protein B [Amphibacillus marinus]
MDKAKVIAILEAKKQTFIEASDQIWETPELRFATNQSVEQHYQVLMSEGFHIKKGVANMKNAYVASYGTGSPVIGILGEYDALSNLSQVADLAEEKAVEIGGNGHACGHNLLGIGAIAGAVGVKEYLEETGQSGTIKLYGCPAEEGGCGKSYLARAGLFDDLDIALSWHPMDKTAAWGSSSLAVYHVDYHFKGTAAHAAGAPELGRSALDAAELMNIGVQYLREHIIDEARIHYAYKDTGGRSPNVVQASSTLFYYIRAPKIEQAKDIFERVNRIAEGAALMTDTKLSIHIDSACYNYIPNKTVTTNLHENLKLLTPLSFTEEEYAYEQKYFDTVSNQVKADIFDYVHAAFPDLDDEQINQLANEPISSPLYPLTFSGKAIGSTDVGDVSWIVPTGQVFIACEPHGTPAHSWQWVANGKSSVAHKGFMTAGKAMALSAIDLINNPELIKQAKKDHFEFLQGRSYVCAIPDDVMPEE